MNTMQVIAAELRKELSTYIREQTFDVDLLPSCFDQINMTDTTCQDLASSTGVRKKAAALQGQEITSICDKQDYREEDEEEDEEEKTQNKIDELKQLKLTATIMMSAFNSKLESLRQSKFDVHEKLLSTDLYLRLLDNCIFKGNDIDYELHHLTNQKSCILEKRELSQQYICIARADHEKVSHDLQCTIAKDKDMEKSFRAKLQMQSAEPLDLDCVDLLYQMFVRRDFASTREMAQKRKKGRSKKAKSTVISALGRRSKMGRQSGRDSNERPSFSTDKKSHEDNSFSIFGTMRQAMLELEHSQGEKPFISDHDPFLGDDCGQTIATDQCSVADVVSPTYDDIPEGFNVENGIFGVMLKLREEKIKQERDVEEAQNLLCEAKGKLDTEEGEEKILSQELDALSSKEMCLKEEKVESTRCPYFVVSIKQGIDEIEMVTAPKGYQDALFLPTEPVDAVNDQIKDLGSQDVDLLLKIKCLRRKIKRLEWNQELFKLKKINAKELTVDYHYLRLSSDLKNMLNGNVEDASKTRKRIKNQLSRQEVTHQTKIERLKKERVQVKRATGIRAKDNAMLEEQFNLLIHDNEEEQKGNEATFTPSQDRMQKIMRLSKRNHLIKRQAIEISSLRKDLDSLRQKNFPSFPALNSA
jgi:hypothetical protein